MIGDDFERWMWTEALRRHDRAERIQREFLRRMQQARPRKQWEPPVDIFETAEAIYVIIALPGVSNAGLTDLEIRGDTLFVAGQRRVPAPADDAVVQRLEIPHGHFVRRFVLPWPRLIIHAHTLVDGCLYLTLAKR